MMRKKAKAITMTVTLILAIILICIKVTHFVIIERPYPHGDADEETLQEKPEKRADIHLH